MYKNYLKELYTVTIVLLAFVFIAQPAHANNNAPNVYLWSQFPGGKVPTDIVINEWQATETTRATYWATQKFDIGYGGFQQHADHTTAHFSLWDDVDDTDDKIFCKYSSPDTTIESFCGEGTGMKASTNYPWQVNEWNAQVIRTWKEGDRTIYGQWIRNPKGEWLLTAVLSHPNKDSVMHSSALFQEDWNGTQENVRAFKMKNHYSRDTSNKNWISHDKQLATASNDKNNWDYGATDDYFWGKAGGNTTSSMERNVVLSVNQPKEPEFVLNKEILLDEFNCEVKDNKLTANWTLTAKSSPQFKAQVVVKNKDKIKKTFDMESYETKLVGDISDISIDEGDTVHLVVTDIFDNKKEFSEDGTSSGNGESGGNGGSEEGTEEHAYAVDFLGYADVKFAEFTYDSTANEGVLESLAINQAPHNNFDEEYATVTVQNKNGKELFKKAYKGTQRLTGATDKIPVEEGYYLTFTHLEADGKPTSRMQIVDKTQETQLENAKSITYEVTKTGWEKADKPEESEDSETPEIPEQTGKRYEAKFKNPSDKDFAIFNFDLNTSKGYLATKKGKPNEAYGDKNYAKIVVQNQNGEEVFKQNYKGNKSYSNKVEQMDIEEGYTITFMHKDKNFTLIEKTENEQLKVKKEITYKVTKNGLKKLG